MHWLQNNLAWLSENFDPSSKQMWIALLNFGKRAGYAVASQIVPVVACYGILPGIRRSVEALEAEIGLPPELEAYMEVSTEELKEAHQLELDRRAKLQAKSQANLTTATLASAFGVGTITLIAKNGDYFCVRGAMVAFIIFAIFSILSLCISAFCAVQGNGVGQVYDLYLLERLSTATYKRATPDENRKAQLIKMIILNQAWTLVVAAFTFASSVAMRNGVIGIGLALAWALVAKMLC